MTDYKKIEKNEFKKQIHNTIQLNKHCQITRLYWNSKDMLLDLRRGAIRRAEQKSHTNWVTS